MKLDGAHPPGASHHQKIVVIDDSLAFCGGIDMTGDRWDTREHRDDEPRRITPGGAPYAPWHDATTAIEGPAAAALGELARDRWRRAGGAALAPVTGRHRLLAGGAARRNSTTSTSASPAPGRTMPRSPARMRSSGSTST